MAVFWSATFRQVRPGREIGHSQTTDGTPIKRLGGALLKVKSETKRRLMYLVNLNYFGKFLSCCSCNKDNCGDREALFDKLVLG